MARAHSTGSEDNGLHVGLDGEWPESGQRLQWCQGKQQWWWESKQRTEKQHCGEPYKIYLDIEQPGEHVISFSMREDGFEFDKWFMTQDRDMARPTDAGPPSAVHSGTMPKAFALVKADPVGPKPDANAHSTNHAASHAFASKALVMPAAMFAEAKLKGYYLDQGKWLAINPNKAKQAEANRTFPFPSGRYHVTLRAVGENDGQSTYQVRVDGEQIGEHTCPLSKDTFEVGVKFHKTFQNVAITEGAIIGVASQIASADGQEYSRARWAAVAFEPADAATKQAAASILARMASATPKPDEAAADTSPTKPVSDLPLQLPRSADGDGSVTISGEQKTWHNITLDLQGPYAHEQDNTPNPFTDYRMNVTFTHADGQEYIIPGYFAADGKAADSGAESGTTWRAHFAPDRTGKWAYQISFVRGDQAALDREAASEAVAPFDGKSGVIDVAKPTSQGVTFEPMADCKYVGKHYLQFAGSKRYFLKVGADAPETLLAFADFDNTHAGNPKKAPIKKGLPMSAIGKLAIPHGAKGRAKG